MLIYNYNRPEFTFLKLDIKVGDSWKIPISSDSSLHEVVQITDTTLWFHKFKVAKILAPQPFNTKILLADSIGLLFLSNEFDTWELKEATINGQQIGSVTSVRPFADSQREALVKSLNNHPNPFNNSTAIEYWLGRPSKVRLSIFNVLGQRIKLLVDSFQPQGLHRIKWFGHNELGGSVSSSIYFYKIEINESVIVNKTLLFLK